MARWLHTNPPHSPTLLCLQLVRGLKRLDKARQRMQTIHSQAELRVEESGGSGPQQPAQLGGSAGSNGSAGHGGSHGAAGGVPVAVAANGVKPTGGMEMVPWPQPKVGVWLCCSVVSAVLVVLQRLPATRSKLEAWLTACRA